jgi:DNA repair exonuclease SbcCD ATPase subunit
VVEARGQELYDYGKDLSAIWAEMVQVDIAFPEESSLVQSLQILRESHVAARAEIDTLRQQLDAARAEVVKLRTLNDALLEKDKRLRHLVEARGHELETQHEDLTEARAEIETLRKQLANAQREASDEFAERQVLQHEASDDYVELARLRAFVGKARETISPTMNYCDVEFLLSALAELDAGPSEPTQVAEPLDPDTRDQELERLYSAIDGDLLAEGISHVCREIGEARKHGADSEPSPVAEPLDAEGGA